MAVAFSILLPLGGDPLGFTSLLIWTIIVAVGSIALLYSNRYTLIERGAAVLVVVFTAVTVLIALRPAVHAVRLRHRRHPERADLRHPRGRARRGAGHVRHHRRRRRRDHLLHVLVRREGVRALGRAERRQRGVGAAGQGLDPGDVQGRDGLLGDLHLRDARLLPHGRGRAASAGSRPRRATR